MITVQQTVSSFITSRNPSIYQQVFSQFPSYTNTAVVPLTMSHSIQTAQSLQLLPAQTSEYNTFNYSFEDVDAVYISSYFVCSLFFVSYIGKWPALGC
jgi:hypothetical protein